MNPNKFIETYGIAFVKDIINNSPFSATLIYYDIETNETWYYRDNGYQAYNKTFKSWSFIFDPQLPLHLSIKEYLVDLCELKRITT